MVSFNREATRLKATGMLFDVVGFETSTNTILDTLRNTCHIKNMGRFDVDLLLSNPNEIMVTIGNIWGQEILKLFFVVSDRDTTKIGKNDVTSRERVELFYHIVKHYKTERIKAEVLYYCLLFHVISYEKDQILKAVKGNLIVHSPTISHKFFGYKKNDYVYRPFVGRFTGLVDSTKERYTINVPNINHIGLLNSLYGMDAKQAREFLSKQENGILENRIPLEVEERILPFLLSESAELLHHGFQGVVADDFRDKLNLINSRSINKQNNFAYAFNSNPYTFFVSEYKINTLGNIINELERMYGETLVYTLVSDSMLCFTLPKDTTIDKENPVGKLVKPVDTLKYFQLV